jgi:integrase
MPRKSSWPPPMKPRGGYDRVRVSLGNGRRREYVLGPAGSEKSRKAYLRLIAELEASRGRPAPPAGEKVTVAELVAAYLLQRQRDYRPEHFFKVKRSLWPVVDLYGDDLAVEFGPVKLEVIRAGFVKEKLSRKYINKLIDCIRACWRWASSRELVPHDRYAALRDLECLKRDRTTAPDFPPVEPANVEDVAAALPYLLSPLRALLQFQVATGCRPGEACLLRPCDITRPWQTIDGKEVWLFSLKDHKGRWRGQARDIPIGPAAQEIIGPFLLRAPEAFCFSPKEALAEFRLIQRSRRKSKVQPSQKDRSKPYRSRAPGERYNRSSYGHAVNRACDAAKVPRWKPNQLRHLAATEVERLLDQDSARAHLGHRHASTTAIYTASVQKAAEIAARLG